MRLSLKILFILLLASAIFGGCYYCVYELFIKPQKLLAEEKAKPPPPPPPDPSLPEFERSLVAKKEGKWLQARTDLEAFLQNYPDSSKVSEARAALGEVNTKIYFSPTSAPEKQLYIVQPNDTLTRVAAKTRSTVELITKINKLTNPNLKIGQRLWAPTAAFSLVIDRKRDQVVLLFERRFFKEYPIRSWPPQHVKKPAGGQPQKIAARVTGTVAWLEGRAVYPGEKNYDEASHWIQISIPSYTLYGEPAPGDTKAQKPPSGIALAPEAMPELALLLRKNDPVTIE